MCRSLARSRKLWKRRVRLAGSRGPPVGVVKTGNKSNNFAAVRYTDASGDSQIAVAVSSKGLGNHAERKLLRQYGDSITEAYSEFQPCTGTNKCRSRLAEAGIPTTWTWGWTTSAEGAAARSAKGKAVTSMFKDAISGDW
ncbi:nucleic acid/nucleotide deaminase domain-containing protein [Streptomyces shenzhenensis]|uniref:nucleic acid/nucleotide deaminase domain-containing protein n=1 Tax=Streptomyces shenzhenensis TaxID=943815 RepID=UPI00380818B3